MKRYISTEFSNGKDYFNLIRFVAASMVLIGHSFELSFSDQGDPLYQLVGHSIAAVSVDVFFVISGFLVTGSLLHRNNLLAFAVNRMLRIYPALIVSILFCVFVVGVIFTQLDTRSFIFNSQTIEFLFGKSTIVGLFFTGGGSDLPGVFLDNPYKGKVNGSLWTLPWEILMYVSIFFIALFALIFKSQNRRVFDFIILAIAGISTLFLIGNYFIEFSDSRVVKTFLRFVSFFFFGSAIYVYKNRVRLSNTLLILFLIVICVSLVEPAIFQVCYHLLLPYCVIGVAYCNPNRAVSSKGVVDYSYGVYIFAFPIQQSCAALIPGIGVLGMVAYCFPVTLFLAILSWHFVEKPALKRKLR